MKPWLRWTILGLVVLLVIGVILRRDKTDESALSQIRESENGREGAVCDTLPESGGAADLRVLAETSRPTTSLPRLLELGSVGCKPCQMMAPIIDELKEEYAGRLSVEFYDVRVDPAPARMYGIRIIPTQIFIDGTGNEIFRHEGYFPKEEILPILAEMGVTD